MKTTSKHEDKVETATKNNNSSRQMNQLKEEAQYQREKISTKEYGACCMATD